LFDEGLAIAEVAGQLGLLRDTLAKAVRAGRRSIKAQKMTKEKVLLLNSGYCFSNQVAEACPEIIRKEAEIQQDTSLETIRNMVASGLGITVLPASANNDRYRSTLLKVIPFNKSVPSRRIALAWRKNFARTLAIEALAQAIGQAKVTGNSRSRSRSILPGFLFCEKIVGINPDLRRRTHGFVVKPICMFTYQNHKPCQDNVKTYPIKD